MIQLHGTFTKPAPWDRLLILTDTQVQVLGAINDHCEVHGHLLLDNTQPMPDLLADLGMPDDELLTAVAGRRPPAGAPTPRMTKSDYVRLDVPQRTLVLPNAQESQ